MDTWCISDEDHLKDIATYLHRQTDGSITSHLQEADELPPTLGKLVAEGDGINQC